jgi:hypothetical protein
MVTRLVSRFLQDKTDSRSMVAMGMMATIMVVIMEKKKEDVRNVVLDSVSWLVAAVFVTVSFDTIHALFLTILPSPLIF